jgi:hypothetical protein
VLQAVRLTRADGGALHALRVLDPQHWLGSASRTAGPGEQVLELLEKSQRDAPSR